MVSYIYYSLRNSNCFVLIDRNAVVAGGLNLMNGRVVDEEGRGVTGQLVNSDGTRTDQGKRNKSGFRYVMWDIPNKKWMVRRKIDGKQTLLGRFSSIEAALTRMKDAGWPIVKQ